MAIYSEVSQKKWDFSIAMFNYQRVNTLQTHNVVTVNSQLFMVNMRPRPERMRSKACWQVKGTPSCIARCHVGNSETRPVMFRQLVGGIPTPLKNMSSSIWRTISNTWENTKCSKPPTSQHVELGFFIDPNLTFMAIFLWCLISMVHGHRLKKMGYSKVILIHGIYHQQYHKMGLTENWGKHQVPWLTNMFPMTLARG